MELIRGAIAGGYAVPGFCIWNAESANIVLRVASDCRAPVILMHGPGEFGILTPAQMAAAARAMAWPYDIPAALHLDHGGSMEHVDQCIAAGYTSVMLDLSQGPFEENVAGLTQVVAKARPLGITVEGEIGAMGRVDEASVEGGEIFALTDPVEAKAYVERTGIDIVAVSVGNAHGNYPTRPHIDFELLARLIEVTKIPVVFHGGSGMPEDDLRKAVSLGITKVNVASELMGAVRSSLQAQWTREGVWVPTSFGIAMETLAPIVEKWIRRTGAAGKA